MLTLTLIKPINQKVFRNATLFVILGIAVMLTGIGLTTIRFQYAQVFVLVGLLLICSRFFLSFFKDSRGAVGKILLSKNEILVVERNQPVLTFAIKDLSSIQYQIVEYEAEQRLFDFINYPGKRTYRSGDINFIEFHYQQRHYRFHFRLQNHIQFVQCDEWFKMNFNDHRAWEDSLFK